MLPLLEVLRRTEAYLKKYGVPTARLDAELLLSHALGIDRVGLYVQFERPLIPAELDRLRPMVARRARREPLAWIVGHREFWDLDLVVHPGVLVPRPETETLIEAALEVIPEEGDFFVADVGAGTGAVGLALASERPGVKVYAIDRSRAALACIRENVRKLGFEKRVAVLGGDLLSPIPQQRPIDLVVSNPPYVRTADLADLAPEIRDWEPREALDGGPDGLAVHRRLVHAAAERARAAVMVEIGHDQATAVRELFEQAGLADVTVRRDLAGRDRVVAGRCKAAG